MRWIKMCRRSVTFFFFGQSLFLGLAGAAEAGVTLAASPNPAIFGSPVTLTAAVTPPTATGKVTFYDGSVVLGTSAVSGGEATLTIPLNVTGLRSLTARYLGDSDNPVVLSPAFWETVNSIASSGFVAQNVSLGVQVYDFAVADFNGDGKEDVASVANSPSVTVTSGNGDGTFGLSFASPGSNGSRYASIVAADFDGDGKVDVAVGDCGLNNVSILLGHGDGTFAQPNIYATACGAIVVADFNSDGIPDLAVVHSNTQSIGILLGLGGGNFGPPMEYSTAGTATAVATGDINGDGKPDLVTTVPTAGDSLLLVVLLGNGDGTFSTAEVTTLYEALPGEYLNQALLLEDLNGDGKLDLAMAASFTYGAWVCLGNGDGTFAAPIQYNGIFQDLGTGAGIAAVDVNADRKLDLITDIQLYSFGSGLGNALQTFYGNGDGTFQSAEVLYPPASHLLYKLVPADFNGDGRVDLLSRDYDESGNSIVELFSGAALPEITIDATHTGSFTPGQTGVNFSVVVSNVGSLPTFGAITLDYAPNGNITLTSIGGMGWSCSSIYSFPTCTRSDALAPGSSYPAILITANIPATAQLEAAENWAIASGGGSETAEALDMVNIVALAPNCTFSVIPSSLSFSGNVNSGALTINTSAGCNWLASSSASWISITSSLSGSGPGSVTFVLSGYSGPALRNGIITAAGQTFTVAQAGPTLGPTAVSPAASSGTTQTFTLTFTDQAGFADISVIDILINNYLDGQQACYIALVPATSSTGYLYLVDDAGDGGYASGSPMYMPSSNSLQNSQCVISAAGSSVSGSGNTLTLTLAITFKAAFAGNKIFYVAARSNTQNSGWQPMATWNVPGAAPLGPGVGGMSPGQITVPAAAFTFTLTDTNGYGDLAVVDILINSALDGVSACYMAYVPTSATTGYLYLVDDQGDGGYAGSPVALPGSHDLSNSQCTVGGEGALNMASGNTLSLTLELAFNSANLSGNQIVYVAARNSNGGNSGWQAVGTINVQ
jgi:large repetitive protein